MLTELHIENFAIIDQLEIHFGSGLIVFTGETGAGKSIIIDALETLLGGRADATLVRSGAERASVEGVFRLPPAAGDPASLGHSIHLLLERENLLDDAEWITLGREIRANGRSVARVNGRSVSVGLLKELGEFLVDVHGQSEHLSLLRVAQHLSLLDRYASSEHQASAGLQETRRRYRQTYTQLQDVGRELEKLRLGERDAARRADTLNYQIQEIETARLQPSEEEELKDERNRLANAESLASLAQEALQLFDDGSPETSSITDLFGQALHALTSLARIDPARAAQRDEAQGIYEALGELTRSLRDYLEGIEFNPRRLDQVEERLALIHSLKRKYGDSITSILEFLSRARQDLDSITHANERIQAFETQQNELLTRLGQEGQALSALRHSAAAQLSQAIETELADLHMPGARFQVHFEQQPDPQGVLLENGQRVACHPLGLEKVEFMIAPNPGEGFKPLAKIASGGETSRLMLALKNVLVKADEIPSLVFDEIDQGIGGRVGTIVGSKLWSLARQHQVLCITHLPQLAVFGDQHFGVAKLVDSGRTTTTVNPLAGEKRLHELAEMLGALSEGTLRSARELLLAVQKQTLPASPCSTPAKGEKRSNVH